MKIMLKIWVLLAFLLNISFAQDKYTPRYLHQDTYNDADDISYLQSGSQHSRDYAPLPYDGVPNINYKHRNLESKYSVPDQDFYSRSSPHRDPPQPSGYYHPEDISYNKPQEISYQSGDSQLSRNQKDVPQSDEGSTYPRSAKEVFQPGGLHYPKSSRDVYQPEASYPRNADVDQSEEETSYPRSAKEVFKPGDLVYPKSSEEVYQPPSQYQKLYQGSSPYESDPKSQSSKYTVEEPEDYTQSPIRSSSQHPRPVPVDPKLPLYFTMYEKRVIADPTDKYGKGPWRFMTYGHGITYGSKEPGKVFEKGYGYVRALGRDHCDLPKHLCPPRSDKPFDYEGRKEPYYGYRPH